MSCSTTDQSLDRDHRRQANRAIAVSAAGLALTGGIELVLALFTGSVALLGDALHNLSDVSTSLIVFLWAHPGWSSLYVQRAWTKELAWTDLLWVAAKVGLSAVAVAAVAFRAGIDPKREPEQVVAGIHATLLRGLLFVLVIHAAFAFLEFT